MQAQIIEFIPRHAKAKPLQIPHGYYPLEDLMVGVVVILMLNSEKGIRGWKANGRKGTIYWARVNGQLTEVSPLCWTRLPACLQETA